MNFRILIIFTFVCTLLYSQSIGLWQNYTNKKNISKIALGQSSIWCATDGGAFEYNFTGGYFNELTKSEGLSSQFITAISIAGDGRVWLGTENGILNIYDPSDGSIHRILDINRSDFSKKAINDIRIINNIVYVSTEFGLSLINSSTKQFIETIIKFGSFPSATIVNSAAVEDVIYACTENGLAVQKEGAINLSYPESWNVFVKGSQIDAGNILSLAKFNSELLIGTDKGLFQYDGLTWNKIWDSQAEVKDLQATQSKLYFITNHSLYVYDGSNFSEAFRTNEFILSSLVLISDDEFYLGSDNGLLYFKEGSIEIILPSGPRTNSFQSVDVDPGGNLWVGTGRDVYGVGVLKFDGNEWTTYNTSTNPELLSNAYHIVYAAPDNSVFLSNWGRGVTVYKDGSFTNYYVNNTDMVGIPNATEFLVIWDVKYDSKGNAWILNHLPANQKILHVLTPGGDWYHYEFGSPLFPEVVETFGLLVDQNDTKWIIVQSGSRGLYYFNENNTLSNTSDDTWGRLSFTDYFAGQTVTSLALDNRGEIWVGTTLGVSIILDPSRPTSQTFSVFSLRQQSINCIAVDPINRKWVGTAQGVFVLSPDGSVLINQFDSKNSPLAGDIIKSITFNENTGVAYIGTDFGLSTLTTESVKPDSDFDELFVYPNPFVLNSSGDDRLTIDGLIENSLIKILTVNGTLVNEFSTPGGRIAFWDGKSIDGKLVSSGTYLIVAYDEEANNIATTKVAVIRKNK